MSAALVEALRVDVDVDALVLLPQAARGCLGLPFVEDEVVAGGHGVLEADAHLSVLAPVSRCQRAGPRAGWRVLTSTSA